MHRSLKLNKKKKVVYTAMSKKTAYLKHHISKFVLKKKAVPLNPFMLFDYFLLDTVKRDEIREANNNLIRISDEIWVFGPISDGVLAEIQIATKLKKPVKYFAVTSNGKFTEKNITEAEIEG